MSTSQEVTLGEVNVAPAEKATCPGCGSHSVTTFYEVDRVPVHSVLLVRTNEEAVNFPLGDIKLGFCEACGFIYNQVFNPNLLNYSAEYEETQGFSPTFNAFHKRLALDLIDRYDLHEKKVIEIGCGKGEFLTLLCQLGNNWGIGFDPAYVPARNVSDIKDRITFVEDFYSEAYAGHQGDFVCCKMTLEHIEKTAEFIGIVRRSVGDRSDAVIFFQIPNATHILEDLVFWDVYYEHCSYFSKGSLARLFRSQGFDVLSLWTDYDNQYLMIEAKPSLGTPRPALEDEESPAELKGKVQAYADRIQEKLAAWRSALKALNTAGRRVVLWGGGSKAVAFLTTLGIGGEVACAVDINPFKHGTYLAKTGHEIVGPEYLKEYKPDVVIVMNPVYHNEIKRDLAKMGLTPTLLNADANQVDILGAA